MSNKRLKSGSPVDTLKNDAARQRWQLFHRAIAHAKATNAQDLMDVDAPREESDKAPSYLSVVR